MNIIAPLTGLLRALVMGIFAFALAPIATHAQTSTDTQEADLYIERCLNAPPNASDRVQQTIQGICMKAFDLALSEAQNSARHSALRRDLYWAQASQINAIYVLIMLKREESFNQDICDHALSGIQAWNQIDKNSALLEATERPRTLDVAQTQCMQFWRG